jgi:hypothetical protein
MSNTTLLGCVARLVANRERIRAVFTHYTVCRGRPRYWFILHSVSFVFFSTSIYGCANFIRLLQIYLSDLVTETDSKVRCELRLVDLSNKACPPSPKPFLKAAVAPKHFLLFVAQEPTHTLGLYTRPLFHFQLRLFLL